MTYTVTITSQGQISIPIEVRRKYHLDKNPRLILKDEENEIKLVPEPDIEELCGMFKTDKKIPWKKIRKELDEAWAHGLV